MAVRSSVDRAISRKAISQFLLHRLFILSSTAERFIQYLGLTKKLGFITGLLQKFPRRHQVEQEFLTPEGKFMAF
jgi:hypothetical protein